jgi:hypothetical protein
MSERVIRQLLAEAGHAPASADMGTAAADGTEAAPALADLDSPETYIGYARADRFASPGGQARDSAKTYGAGPLRLNDWSLEGNWTIGRQSGALNSARGAITYRFHARDMHLVLGSGKPVQFRLTIDGRAPGPDAGIDVKPDGTGIVHQQRLYQLVRQKGEVHDHTVRIEFLGPGVEAFAFTFG